MKKISFILTLFFATFILSAQVTDTVQKEYPKNEISINLLNSVLGLPEVDYEYFIQDNFGIGIAAMYGIRHDTYNINYAALPYARLYFGNKLSSGFFIEANTGVLSHTNTFYDSYYIGTTYYSNVETKSFTGFAMGVATGFKLLTRNNWIGTVHLGVGRSFGKYDYIYPRIGISIGKRF